MLKKWRYCAISINEKGITKYRSHYPEHIRSPLLDAFEESINNSNDWWENFQSSEETLRALGRLWNCCDAVPYDVRVQATQWLESEGCNEEICKNIVRGCTFARLVRQLKPILINSQSKYYMI
jgi:Sec7-like guanine-nucleotide exchange factor